MLIFLFIGTNSCIIQHPQKDQVTNSRICSIFVNNLIEGEKLVRMTNLSMNSRESIHRHSLKRHSNKPDKAYLPFLSYQINVYEVLELLISFANSLFQNQYQQNVCPDLDTDFLTL